MSDTKKSERAKRQPRDEATGKFTKGDISVSMSGLQMPRFTPSPTGWTNVRTKLVSSTTTSLKPRLKRGVI